MSAQKKKQKRKNEKKAPTSLAEQAARQTTLAEQAARQTTLAEQAKRRPSLFATMVPRTHEYDLVLAESPEQRSSSFIAKFSPECMILLSLAWMMLTPAHWWKPDAEALWFGITGDFVMLMVSCTLIDIASRLQSAPPWWIAPFAVLGLLMLTPDLVGFMVHAFQLGWLVVVPFLWSVIERLRELWTLPTATTLEKIRRRTLTFDRLYVALIIGMSCLVFGLVAYMAFDIESRTWLSYTLWIVWSFYAISCYNIWRVHQEAFVKRPRSLVPKWIDLGESTYLNPL
jgi:hypothetical protein